MARPPTRRPTSCSSISALATISIVVLVAVAIGWREALVVAVVIPTTILLTLFAAKLMGYTINRVSLFALIFSIGILVDDAIVVIENIARHWAMHDGRSRMQAAIEAVAEVGNPTIVATLTVVAALLPMLFVSGLMGPYMARFRPTPRRRCCSPSSSPVMLTPWLMLRLAPRDATQAKHAAWRTIRAGAGTASPGLHRPLYRRSPPVIREALAPGRSSSSSASRRLLRLRAVCTKSVTVKLLPFDNKSELQVVARSPRERRLEDTERGAMIAAAGIAANPGSYARSRPMPARRRHSTSTASSATIISAASPELGECRSTSHPKATAAAPATRSRSSCASGSRPRSAGRDRAQGRRAAARSAGAFDAARRDLRPRRGDAARGRRRGARSSSQRALHRRHRRLLRRAAAASAPRASIRTSSNIYGVEQARRVRHDPTPCFGGVTSAIRTAAAAAIRSRSPCGCRSAPGTGSRGCAGDAGPCQRHARQRSRGRARRCGPCRARAGVHDLPA